MLNKSKKVLISPDIKFDNFSYFYAYKS